MNEGIKVKQLLQKYIKQNFFVDITQVCPFQIGDFNKDHSHPCGTVATPSGSKPGIAPSSSMMGSE